jgi:Tol biopolymer transport system component
VVVSSFVRWRGFVSRGLRQTLLAMSAVLGLLALAPAHAAATFPGRNGLIAWSYMVNGNEGPTPPQYGLLKVAGFGGGDHSLRSCSTFGYCEEWADVSYSPNGRQLAWDIYTPGASRVILADADGPHAVTVVVGFDPSFSPSGRRLIYVRPYGHIYQIVTSNLHGKDVQKLLGVTTAADPQISPNGKQILFARGTTIWIMDANGRDAKPIIASGKAPDWAPRGTEIAYVGVKSARVYTARPDGADRHELPADGLCYPPSCGGGSNSNFAIFSPNGRYVAFDDIDGSGDPGVYTMPANGGAAKGIDSVWTDDAGGSALGMSWQSLH